VDGFTGTQFVGTQIAPLLLARWLRSLATLAALTLGLLLWADDADARFEEGLSFAGGTAGAFSSSSLSAASIAADNLAALDGWLLPSVAQPTYPGGSLGGLFNRPGLIGGFAAGFLGAGLLGLLFGHGVVGELGSVASVLGLAFQLALIVMLARLIWTWWNIDHADARAGLSPRQLADAYGRPRHEVVPDLETGHDFGETADDGLGHPK
jgi:hypothetical protein